MRSSPFAALFIAIALAVPVACAVKVFRKAGYSTSRSIVLGIVSLAFPLNLLVLIWFAFASWPNLNRAQRGADGLHSRRQRKVTQ